MLNFKFQIHDLTSTKQMNRSIADLRKEYTLQALNETDATPDPFQQFQAWFEQAIAAQLPEPNAMILATATPNGVPSARVVLLKGLDDRGFVFYTNYQSQKGQQLADNPYAALVFLWTELERQVRIEGITEKVSAEASDAYFYSRPLGSRLGAWASDQSQVIESREVLEQRLAKLEREYQGQEVPRPPHWGGYRVLPNRIEFWQGRQNRLHDRLCYQRQPAGNWEIQRLSP